MGRTRRPAAVGVAFVAAALAAGSAPTVRAEGGAPKTVTVRDAQCPDPTLLASDALALALRSDAEGLHVTVTMAAPIAGGPFLCVHLYIDADDNAETGIGGNEIWFRAAVGSRFRGVPAAGAAAADRSDGDGDPDPSPARGAGLLSLSVLTTQSSLDGGAENRTWLNQTMPGAPTVDGATIRFVVPADRLSRGTEWASPAVAVRASVETWVGDRPLVVEHVVRDDGLPIAVDGDDGEWSGGATDTDPGDELPPHARHLDLVRLRVEHEGRNLFACLTTSTPGFAGLPRPNTDVVRTETLHVLAEPVDAAYDAPRRIALPRGRPKGSGATGDWAVFGRVVEVSLPRSGLDGRTRVLAWSEGVRRDSIPDAGTTRIARPVR